MWEAWKYFPDSAVILVALHPYTELCVVQLQEHFIVILYDKTSDQHPIDEDRKELFCFSRNGRQWREFFQLKMHYYSSKYADYQAGIWCISEQSEQHVPTPEGWG